MGSKHNIRNHSLHCMDTKKGIKERYSARDILREIVFKIEIVFYFVFRRIKKVTQVFILCVCGGGDDYLSKCIHLFGLLFIFTLMHLADAFIQSDLRFSDSGYTCLCQYMCSQGIEPTTFALLMQCFTTEPQCDYYVIIIHNIMLEMSYKSKCSALS